MGSYVFEVVDKTGRRVHLTKERWKHITSPTSLHAYMVNYLDDVKKVLIKPDKITYSIYDDKANYYRYYKGRKQYLRVIVKYLNGEGFIISAYFISDIR